MKQQTIFSIMTNGTLCLLVLLTSSICSASTRTGLGFEWKKISQVVINENILSITGNVESAIECVMMCLSVQDCVSVFYRQVFRRCQFHDLLFVLPQNATEDMGTEYYSLTTGTCPPGYIHVRTVDLCYQLHLRRKTVHEAAADCATRGEHLIVINNQAKQDHVSKQLISTSANVNYFIDGSDAITEGQWVYHDGKPVTYFAWADDHVLNKKPDKDYLVMNRNKGAFLWVDKAGTIERFYICEKDM